MSIPASSYSLRNVLPVGGDSAEPCDIHVDLGGRVAERACPGAKDIDCHGRFVSPGWADLHVHVWHGASDFAVRADDAGLKRGVTAMVDAGSAGEANFYGFREYVINKQRETVRAFLNIGTIGLVAANRVSELFAPSFIDVERTRSVIEANRDVICGIKVRCSGTVVGDWGIEPLHIAKRLASEVGLPLMVHIGEAPPEVEEVLDLLGPGDLVTHCFHGKAGSSLLETPERLQLAMRAADRGVRFDVGHGAASYSFRSAERAISSGFLPFSISTDLHGRNINGPVYDLATTVSKLHAAGLSFEQCVAAIAIRPREFLGLGTAMAPGMRADFTVFSVDDCDLVMSDSLGAKLRVLKAFVPYCTALGTYVQKAEC